jgi:hypothetical protein
MLNPIMKKTGSDKKSQLFEKVQKKPKNHTWKEKTLVKSVLPGKNSDKCRRTGFFGDLSRGFLEGDTEFKESRKQNKKFIKEKIDKR